MTRFYPYPFFGDNCFVVLPVGRPLWREDESVTYSEIADWSDHWGPITIHYCLIWDCVPSSSPLTTRRDYGGGILTRLHTGFTFHWKAAVYGLKGLGFLKCLYNTTQLKILVHVMSLFKFNITHVTMNYQFMSTQQNKVCTHAQTYTQALLQPLDGGNRVSNFVFKIHNSYK
jgi:hypothetical protein